MKIILFILSGLLALLLTALIAPTMGWALEPPPADWPKVMHVSYAVMGDHEIYKMCGSVGCAFPDPITRTCMIFLAQSHQTDWVVEHERLHCEGWSHEKD